MKGFAKVMKRAPHIVSSKVGLASKSTDVEFDHIRRKYEAIEKLTSLLASEGQTFLNAVKRMLSSSTDFAREFSLLFHPFGREYDLERRHPEAVQTLANLTDYVTFIDQLRETLRPEQDLIASRIVAPLQEVEAIMKSVEKAISKRDHKLIDFDRHNNAYTKLKDKQNRSSKDDQHMFKLETECETAAADYEFHNDLLKEELPQFLSMATRLITPIFYSFYYMELNIYYTTLERIQEFAKGKFDISENNLLSHEHKYATSMTAIVAQMEQISIRKPTPPSARILQLAKSGQPLTQMQPKDNLGPLPEATEVSAPPPAYSAAEAAAVPEKASSYVIALYDYAAQAAGDLSFSAGDRIEVVERTPSTEDWWTGTLNGMQGVFPGYVLYYTHL
ncbi:BAR adaptor protein Hob1 [Malassezia vespertilionis]|uniref:BAR adaptor protein Hob1 n=1 Tax=Malassezia vespertilionis TaxID=2020962 RepID=UPI0024B1E596|nr:BAR adaptor protein Hob1 [Malassezia vespertilionis]WFD07019.1 BAR adaptor protein Hob1 [Malassezia vespertilionis]